MLLARIPLAVSGPNVITSHQDLSSANVIEMEIIHSVQPSYMFNYNKCNSHYHFCIKQETPTSSAMNVTPTLSARLLRSVTKALVRSCRPSPVAGVS